MTIDLLLRSAREVTYRVLDTVVVWLEVEVFDPLGRRFPQADWKFVAIFAALLFPFFEPVGLRHVISPVFGTIYLVMQVVAIAVIAVLYVFRTPKDKFSLLAIAIVAFMFLTTVANERLGRLWIYTQWFYDWAPVAAAVLLTAYARYTDSGKIRELLWAVMLVTGLLSVVNLISVFLWPHLIDPGTRAMLNFYGHKNSSIYVALPSVGASLMLDALAGRRCSVRSALLYIAAVLQCLISYSATSVATLFVLAALMVVVQFRGARPFVNGLSCLGACGILSLLIMVGPVRGLFSPLIEGILGKTLTFTGRTFIWDSVLDLVAGKRLLVGYGSSIRFNIVAQGIPYSDPHSFLLYLWLSGGIVGFVLCAALLVLAVEALYRCRRGYPAAVLAVVVACFLVIGLMESLITIAWPLFVALAYYWRPSEAHCR
ncbi:O-antigen ligase family protein [Adlercreutzia muris]|uniref:O-antigen ligase family protein n=1 Tax=Adlercreutzia muris TaxID=1796610 RepID=UPI0021D5AC8A|nr:O-antigen ligase family protein [Adlercreutzia muris]MCU7584841.1 O-antigen ligase family protein [Adlercreutzia muris]